MVFVGVGDQHPRDAPRRGGQQRSDMAAVVGAGVEQRPVVAAGRADEVGVGARPGHHAAVVGGDAQHTRRQPDRHAGFQLDAGRAAALGVEPAEFGIGPVAQVDGCAAAGRLADPRPVQRDAGLRAGPGHHVGGAGEAAQVLERDLGDVHQLQITGPCHRLGGCQPQLLHRLGAVFLCGLASGRLGDEEAGVEDLGQAFGRDPMGVVSQPVGRQPHVEAVADLGHAGLVGVQRAAQRHHLVGRQRVQVDHRAAGIGGEQQAGFLETFTHRSDPVVQTVRRDTQPGAGRGVVEAVAALVVAAVALVEQATGEHGGAAVLVAGALGAAQHQHLHAARRVAQHDQRGGGTRHRRWCVGRGAGQGRPVLSLSDVTGWVGHVSLQSPRRMPARRRSRRR